MYENIMTEIRIAQEKDAQAKMDALLQTPPSLFSEMSFEVCFIISIKRKIR